MLVEELEEEVEAEAAPQGEETQSQKRRRINRSTGSFPA
jgi:hypothetical protein